MDVLFADLRGAVIRDDAEPGQSSDLGIDERTWNQGSGTKDDAVIDIGSADLSAATRRNSAGTTATR